MLYQRRYLSIRYWMRSWLLTSNYTCNSLLCHDLQISYCSLQEFFSSRDKTNREFGRLIVSLNITSCLDKSWFPKTPFSQCVSFMFEFVRRKSAWWNFKSFMWYWSCNKILHSSHMIFMDFNIIIPKFCVGKVFLVTFWVVKIPVTCWIWKHMCSAFRNTYGYLRRLGCGKSSK